MPLWMFMALMVPFTLGIVNVIDKLVVERFTSSIYFYAFWIGVMEIPVGVFLLLGFSLDGPDWSAILGGFLLGIVRSGSLIMLLTALRHGQLARVAPVYYLYPIMVAPMSAIFLNDKLELIIWGAIVLSVMGAGLVTWQGGGDNGPATQQDGATMVSVVPRRLRGYFSQPKAQGFALVAAFLFASSSVVASRVLDTEPFWDVFAASRIGLGVGAGGVALCTAGVRKHALGMYKQPTYMGLVVLSEITVTGAIMLNLRALDLGPASEVTALGALQPAVILAYSAALFTLWPRAFTDWVTTKSIITQVLGIGAISTAVALIALAQR